MKFLLLFFTFLSLNFAANLQNLDEQIESFFNVFEISTLPGLPVNFERLALNDWYARGPENETKVDWFKNLSNKLYQQLKSSAMSQNEKKEDFLDCYSKCEMQNDLCNPELIQKITSLYKDFKCEKSKFTTLNLLKDLQDKTPIEGQILKLITESPNDSEAVFEALSSYRDQINQEYELNCDIEQLLRQNSRNNSDPNVKYLKITWETIRESPNTLRKKMILNILYRLLRPMNRQNPNILEIPKETSNAEESSTFSDQSVENVCSFDDSLSNFQIEISELETKSVPESFFNQPNHSQLSDNGECEISKESNSSSQADSKDNQMNQIAQNLDSSQANTNKTTPMIQISQVTIQTQIIVNNARISKVSVKISIDQNSSNIIIETQIIYFCPSNELQAEKEHPTIAQCESNKGPVRKPSLQRKIKNFFQRAKNGLSRIVENNSCLKK